ncbi:MAG: S9 family peptidase [Candidatus Krumholzibacteriota bacterium]|nr:S9 family peptidase [Candidatus Krumholzibacteriota bacterium]
MKVRKTAVLFLAVLTAALSVAMAASSEESRLPWSPKDIWQLKRVSDNNISPDGKWIAYVVSVTDYDENRGDSDIWVIPSSGGEPKKMTNSPKGDNHPRWSPDGRDIAFLSSRDGSTQIYIIPFGGGEARKITDFPGGVGDMEWLPSGSGFIFTGRVYPDCPDLDCVTERDKAKEERKLSAMVHRKLLYRHWDTYEDGKAQHLFTVDAGGGDPVDITAGLEYDALTYWLASAGRDFDVSPDGKTVYFSGKQDPDQAVSYNEEIWSVPVTGGEIRRITSNPAADSHPRVSPCGRFLAWRGTRRPGYESDRYEIMVLDLKGGKPKSLTADFDRSVSSLFWSHDGSKIYFEAEDKADIDLFSVDAAGGAVKKVVGAKNAGKGYHLGFDAGPKDRFFTFLYRPMKHYYEIFRIEPRGGRSKKITDVNADVYAKYHFPDAEEVWFEGSGGTMVHGFLVKPMNFDPAVKYPMLVRIHGGPQQMFGYAYRTEFAVFSGSGYAVFFCNPRGSTGYGTEFCDGINYDWGGKVIEDIKNGVRHVIANNEWIDETKVGAWGGSFGGFVCNWFQGHNSDKMFSVLVTHAGEADQWSSYGSTEELWFPEWEFGGTPWDTPEMNDEMSPIRYAGDFNTPHLIIHGELDYRVPITGGEQMFTALQRQGVPSKMIRYPDENHWILKPHNSRFWYASILDWFDQWLRRGGEELPIEGFEDI